MTAPPVAMVAVQRDFLPVQFGVRRIATDAADHGLCLQRERKVLGRPERCKLARAFL
jgi:hypothetical protein